MGKFCPVSGQMEKVSVLLLAVHDPLMIWLLMVNCQSSVIGNAPVKLMVTCAHALAQAGAGEPTTCKVGSGCH